MSIDDERDPDGRPAEDGAPHGQAVDGGAGERAAEGVEHLQRAAREMIAAARSFLDAVEHVVDDHRAVEELSSTVSDLAAGLGDVLGRREEPWAAAAWQRDASGHRGDRNAEPVVDLTDRGHGRPGTPTDDTEDWARPLVDPSAQRRPSRVRRISVE